MHGSICAIGLFTEHYNHFGNLFGIPGLAIMNLNDQSSRFRNCCYIWSVDSAITLIVPLLDAGSGQGQQDMSNYSLNTQICMPGKGWFVEEENRDFNNV